ncbi:MAG: nucleotidyltransferase family protein, partial [Eubacterium sp.]|nr:nucleotidyltransferase family protein [Eubacterium sp.]
MSKSNYFEAFLALVRAGLWEKDVELRKYGATDFTEIMRLSEEQSVVGLVTAGLEHDTDVNVPQEDLLQFIGLSLQLEQQNRKMNKFIGVLIDKLRKADIYTILVKGQGLAQCYEKPLWRASGDVDLYLSESNYQAAKEFLTPLASHVDNEE